MFHEMKFLKLSYAAYHSRDLRRIEAIHLEAQFRLGCGAKIGRICFFICMQIVSTGQHFLSVLIAEAAEQRESLSPVEMVQYAMTVSSHCSRNFHVPHPVSRHFL